MQQLPTRLAKGARIGIVSPSRLIDPPQLEHAIRLFEQWGLEVQFGEYIYASHGYFAGNDEQRLSELQHMLDDPSISAIFCARGGYGMTRIIDDVNLTKFKEHPKWVIGFSDITALHLALSRHSIPSIHGLMPAQFGYDGVNASIKSLKELLFTGTISYRVSLPQVSREGVAKAEIIGGNLSLLADSLGTATEVITDGKILFIEEIDEYLYKVDRMLMQLQRAGKFASLAGVIIGDFSDMKDTAIPFGTPLDELLIRYFEGDYPVAYGFPAGHEAHHLALPLTWKVNMEVREGEVLLSV